MAKISLTFTEDHIKLIKCLRFRKLEIKRETKSLELYTRYIQNCLDLNGVDKSVREEVNDLLEKIDAASRKDKAYAKEEEDKYYGFDSYDFFNSDNEAVSLAYILGCEDSIIEGTEEDYDGPKFKPEVVERFGELMDFIYTNIVHIEDILHQRCDKGGIKPNVTYVSLDHEGIWYTEEEFKEKKRKK